MKANDVTGKALKRLRRALMATEAQQGTVPDGSAVLIACSGGPDSMALLYWLSQWRPGITGHTLRLGVAIVDHGLRPESGAEVKLVQQELVRLSTCKDGTVRAGLNYEVRHTLTHLYMPIRLLL